MFFVGSRVFESTEITLNHVDFVSSFFVFNRAQKVIDSHVCLFCSFVLGVVLRFILNRCGGSSWPLFV